MINHKDVRIDNLVMYDNRVFKIHTIAEEFPTLDTTEFGIGVVGWDDLDPVTLTEEWLVKFGLELDDDCVIYYKKYIRQKYGYIVVNGKTFDTEVGASGYLAVTIKDCKAHQLQNLYYALSGMELTIKEIIK